MKVEQWFNQCKPLNEGRAFSESFLNDCYNNISREEIKACKNYQLDNNLNPALAKYLKDNTELLNK